MTKLNRKELEAVLAASGYTDKFIHSEFVRMIHPGEDDQKAMYKVTFEYGGGFDTGFIYVWETPDGLRADY